MICRSKRVSLLALREPAYPPTRPPAKLCLSVSLNELVSEGGRLGIHNVTLDG